MVDVSKQQKQINGGAMNWTDLIYELVVFFFDYFWHFVALIILILTFQGRIYALFEPIKKFIEAVKKKYRAKMEAKKYVDFKKPEITIKEYMKQPLHSQEPIEGQ